MRIYQIFYDKTTEEALDPDFIPLDNTQSERPDWFEYWPIRQKLLNHSFEKDEYIGFLSPRFKEKVGLSGRDVISAVERATRPVVSFSPFFDLNAMSLNSFYQAEGSHPGCLKLSQEFMGASHIAVNLPSLVQDQTRIIFSNYFVAKFSFWKKWTELTDCLFEASEKSGSLAERLKENTHYKGQQNYPMKVFIMERMVSVVLELENLDAEIVIDHAKYFPHGGGSIFSNLLVLDALKGQYRRTRSDYYLGVYMNLRKQLLAAAGRSPSS